MKFIFILLVFGGFELEQVIVNEFHFEFESSSDEHGEENLYSFVIVVRT